MATLDRKTIVRIYCYCRQAERSLHRACDPANAWSGLQAFYDDRKRDAVRRLLTSLSDRLPPGSAPASAELVAPSLWRNLSGLLFARWKRRWRFRDHEVRLVSSGLDQLLSVLDAPVRPDLDTLIRQRRQLVDCQAVIEARCPGLAELHEARNVAYFDQNPGSKAIEVSELVPDAA